MEELKNILLDNVTVKNAFIDDKLNSLEEKMLLTKDKEVLLKEKIKEKTELSNKIKDVVTKEEHDRIVNFEEISRLEKNIQDDRNWYEKEKRSILSQRNIVPIDKIKNVIANLDQYQVIDKLTKSNYDNFYFNIEKVKDKELTLYKQELENLAKQLTELNIIWENKSKEARINSIDLEKKHNEIKELRELSSRFTRHDFSLEMEELMNRLEEIERDIEKWEVEMENIMNQRNNIFNNQDTMKQIIWNRQNQFKDTFEKLRLEMDKQMICIDCIHCSGGSNSQSEWVKDYCGGPSRIRDYEVTCTKCKGAGIYRIFKVKDCERCIDGVDDKGKFCCQCLYGKIYYMD